MQSIDNLDQIGTFQNEPLPESLEFAEHISALVNGGAQAVMLSIGHRSGLLDTMAKLSAATSTDIAEASGLAERYVREWLAALVTAKIIEYRPETGEYSLPPAHAACLTRNAPLGNLAIFAQFVALLGRVQEQTLDLLRSGGGAQYGDFPCFHDIMAEDSTQSVVESLLTTVLPLIDGIQSRLRDGIEVLDAGCGKGKALIEMARHFPKSQFTGLDLCTDTIDEAKLAARELGLGNISFAVQDMDCFEQTCAYDFVTTFDAIHDQKHPAEIISKLKRALKPGGVYLMQDIGASSRLENNIEFPMASLLYAMSLSHCTPISIGQNGDGLGTMWGWETAQEMLKAAGFGTADRFVLEHDPLNVWFVCRTGE